MPSPIGQPLQHCHSPSHFTQADADEFDNNEFFEGRFANEVLARMRGIVTQSSPHTPNHLDSQDEQYMLQAIQQSRITAYEHGDMPGPSDFLSTAQSSGAIERQPVSSSQRYAPHQQPQRSSSPPRTSMPPERMSSPIGHPAPQSSQGYNSYTPPSPTSPMHPPTPPSMQRRSPSRLPIRYDIYGNQRTNDDEDNDYPWNTPNSSPKR
ncbi:hypothetical protein [Xenorhabdus mauleonii]|nr:hypothetical protein [Xenorhabdus mauleonii]